LNIPNISSKDSITIGQAVKLYAKVPLEAEPGEKWIYGWNLDIAGYLIEILSGMPFDEYLRTTIFEPLGMKDTYFFLPDEKADRLVTIYTKRGKDDAIKRLDNEFYQTYPISGAKTFFSGGGGLCGTVEDYAKFCTMMLNGGSLNGKHILGRKTVELMTKNQMGTGEDGWGWSLGFEVVGKSKEYETLASAGSYYWSGMFSTYYHIDPKENMAILFYFNVLDFYNPGYFEKFKLMVYQTIFE
jgi:CubicO group peptidase (beta-lactamase class C family)